MTVNDSCHNRHMRIILQSGILLDEDIEFILNNYTEPNEVDPRNGFTLLQKVLGIVSFTSTLFVIKTKLYVKLTIPITISPIVVLVMRKLRNTYVKRKRLRDIEVLVDAMFKNIKLHRQVHEYLKLRNVPSSSMANVYNPFTQIIEEFVKNLFDEDVQILSAYKNNIELFSTKIVSLKFCDYVKELDFEELLADKIDNIKDCLVYLKKLYDIYILLGSHFLTCLVIALSPKNQFDDNEILDNIVPKMKTTVLESFTKINKHFDRVKYHYLQNNYIKQHKIRPETTVSKLHVATSNTMMHSAEILEKSSVILKKLEEINLQTQAEKEILGECIAELKNNVYSYYESVDVLHSLYEISINKPKTIPEIKEVLPKTEAPNQREVPKTDASLNPVEPSQDEEFELYIGPNDSFEEIDFNYTEQDNLKFASLLSQELKQKLKLHARFVAAKNKRGILEEETDIPVKPDESVPTTLNEAEQSERSNESNNVDLPPPLPPPLPVIGHESLTPETNTYVSSSRNFLESIVNAAKIHKNIEDVFGESGSDCESESSIDN